MDELDKAFLEDEDEYMAQEPAAIDDLDRQFLEDPEPPAPVDYEEPPFMASVGRGMLDVGQGLKQLYLQATDPEAAREYQRQVDEEIALYTRGRGPDAGFDPGRLVGEVAGTLPTMLLPGGQATAVGRVLKGAVEGGLAGGSLYAGENDSRIGNAVAGTVGGAAVPAGIEGVVRGGSAVADKFSQILNKVKSGQVFGGFNVDLPGHGVDLTGLGEQAVENLKEAARQQMNATGQVDAETLNRIANAERLGFTGDIAPTMGQATRVPEAWSTERSLAKLDEIGRPLNQRLRGQERQFATIMEEMQPSMAKAENAYQAGESIFDATHQAWKSSQDAVGKLYKQADEDSALDTVSLDEFWSAMPEFTDDATLDPLTESIRRKLTRHGVIDAKGNLTGEYLGVKQAESIRKWLGKLSDKNEPALKRAKGMMIDALDDSVINSLGDDAYKTARDAARARFSAFESKILDDIVRKDAAPDALYKRVLNGNVRDIVGLKSLMQKTPEGKLAWENTRKQVLQDLMDAGTDEAGAGWSGARYSKALKKIGPQRLEQLFSGEEMAKLANVKDVGMDMTYEPVGSTVNYSNTAPALVNMLMKSRMVPMIGDQLADSAQNRVLRGQVDAAMNQPGLDPDVMRGALENWNQNSIQSLLGEKLMTKFLRPGKATAGLLLADEPGDDYLQVR